MKSPTQKQLRDRLAVLMSFKPQEKAAQSIYTPARTLRDKLNGTYPISGIWRAYIEAEEEVRKLRITVKNLTGMD